MNDEHAVLEEIAALLNSLRGVFDGEEVDELAHALQSASHAIADGADDELVLASALHDLARSPLSKGPTVSRTTCRAGVAHSAFRQRVGLAGRRARRGQALSRGHRSGVRRGAFDGNRLRHCDTRRSRGRRGLRLSPVWPDAVRLRRYDDRAKVPGAPTVSVDEVLEVARRVGAAR